MFRLTFSSASRPSQSTSRPLGSATMLTAAGLQVIFAAVGSCGPEDPCGHSGPGSTNGLENAPSSAAPPLGVTPEVVSPGTAGTPGTDETFGTWSAPGRSPNCGPLGASIVAHAAGVATSASTVTAAASTARRNPVADEDPLPPMPPRR